MLNNTLTSRIADHARNRAIVKVQAALTQMHNGQETIEVVTLTRAFTSIVNHAPANARYADLADFFIANSTY